MGNTLTAPTPTATGKQPKTRKLTKAQNRMGWDNIRAPHPRKEDKDFTDTQFTGIAASS